MKNGRLTGIAAFLRSKWDCDLQVSDCQIDSRCVSLGSLFFALKGAKCDGHDFLQQVKEKGGSAAVVSEAYRGPDHGLALIRVSDVESVLQDLAREFLKRAPAKIVAVTGSVGKTTTKDFTASILEGKYRTGKTLQSQNSRLTLPLTILNRTGDEEVLVLEMGMSEPGDIDRLVAIAPPDIAILTKAAFAHAAQFAGGLKEIAYEKGKIFSSKATKFALFGHDFYQFPDEISKIGCEKMSFSLKAETADYFLAPDGNRWKIREKGVWTKPFDFPFPQEHFLFDFLAASAAARQLGMEWSEIFERIANLQLPKMRFEKIQKEGILLINDAYNANPESMKAALSNLPKPEMGRKRIAVLGTMKELGPFSFSLHQEIGRFAQKYVDHLFVFGDEAAPMCEAFSASKKDCEWFTDRKKLSSRLKQVMQKGDVVLIKGSRSMKMEEILGDL